MVKQARVVDAPCSTLDYFPTVLDALGFQSAGQMALVDNRYKLVKGSDRGRPDGVSVPQPNAGAGY